LGLADFRNNYKDYFHLVKDRPAHSRCSKMPYH